MARTALTVKTDCKKMRATREHKAGKKITFPTRVYNRCTNCGRQGGYMRKFEICRICFRELAREGKIMGVTKSSW
ncbi:type Z 30S ribosomal protein S14 [Candidatus Peregrinibacteria bacterium]|nr:type Z 30S ribosomal protein S14 [Candidatus Peregrinibacteria bacterium]